MSSNYARYNGLAGAVSSSGVTSLNGETGAITLVAGTGISITPSGTNITIANTEAGGTVTSVSVVSANGLAGTVANATTTPAITLSTTINAALLAGNGTALSAASLTSANIYVGNASNVPVGVALSGDATLANTGALTLNTVNSNVGSFGTTSSIPSFTVNAKGLITAASGNASTATPTASIFAGWDANKNLSANSLIDGYATTATAAGTTTLTVSSAGQQYFTGTTTQTVLLPVTSTLVLGQQFIVANNSTGVVTVQSSGANTIQAMAGSSYATFTCILTSGTTAASWSVSYVTNAESNGITALTGDVTATGPGSVAATLATVNSNVGSFTYSSITVNGKGLVTAASSGSAPVTTLAAFGSTPNANGLSLSSNTLNMQPASSTQPGGVSTTTQTFAGAKTLGANASEVQTVGAASNTAQHVINGGVKYTVKSISASTYSVDATTTDYLIYADPTINAITITLPTPTAGRYLFIQDSTGQAGTNNITINQHTSEKINGLNSFIIAQNYNSVVLTSDGTNWFAERQPASGSSFFTSGTTYTTPVNINPQTRFKFTLLGAGGAGGGSPAAGLLYAGGGGGAGALGILFITGLSANTGYTYAIGAGGTGVSNNTGNSGGNTTLTIGGTTYTAGGGAGGAVGSSVNPIAGGAGGTATNFTMNIVGVHAPPTGGGNAVLPPSAGAASQYGSAGFTVSFPGTGATNGSAASGFGSGGSGGATGGASGANSTGGAGTAGFMLVEWQN